MMNDLIIQDLDDVYNVINRMIPRLFFKVEIESYNVFIYVPKLLVDYISNKLQNMFSNIYIVVNCDQLFTAFVQVIEE